MSASNGTKYTSSLYGSYAYTDTLKAVHYGPGCTRDAVHKLLRNLGSKKALVVTGKTLHTKTDIVRKVEGILKEKDAYAGTFWEIGQHSPIADIKRGVQIFRDAGADLIIAVGGGSPVDAAKAILFFVQKETGGRTLPSIAIPTTLSAAEYTAAAGYTTEQGVKASIASLELAPAAIILDAELTLATPDRLWLSTGIRAVDHAVENLYRPLVPPPVKHLAYAALADLFTYLPLSKKDPQDIVIRQKLQIASWMSLWPLRLTTYNPIGLSHTLGHKLGASYDIPHGITSCLTLARVVTLKAEIASEDDKQWLAGALVPLHQSSTGSTVGDIHKLAKLINELVADLGLPSDLEGYNVPREDLPKIAEMALKGKDSPLYPKIIELLEDLYPKA